MFRSSANPPSHAYPSDTASFTCSEENPVQITVGDVQARLVRERRRIAKDRARLGHGAEPEGLELLAGEPVEVLLGGELLR